MFNPLFRCLQLLIHHLYYFLAMVSARSLETRNSAYWSYPSEENFKPLVTLAYYTEMREAEILSLKWSGG